MDNETKEIIQRAFKLGLETFSLEFLKSRGIKYEYVGSYEYITEKIYYIPELDYIFSIRP